MKTQQTIIQRFAEKYNLKAIRRRGDGDYTIRGKYGFLFDLGSRGRIGLQIEDNVPVDIPYVPDRGPMHPDLVTQRRLWLRVRRAAESAKMEIREEGDLEGLLVFDPDNGFHSLLAIDLVGTKQRRKLSPEHRAALAAGAKAHRFAS